MNHNEFQHIAEQLFGKAVWLVFAYLSVSIFKGLILNVYEGLMVFLGNDLNQDDVVYLGTDERPARIVRMGIRKTVFYMKDQDGRWNIKMAVPNESLKTMVIKKQLPKMVEDFTVLPGAKMDNKEIYGILVKHDERLKNIYSGLSRIEKHLDKLNGKVDKHETDIAKMQVWGGIALITFPIIVNTIMRII